MSIITRRLKALRRAVKFLKETRGYHRHFQTSYIAQFRRLRQLYEKDNYTSEEILALGIANPRISLAELQQYISKHDLLKIQYSLNNAHNISLTEDKTFFYGLCDSFHIPSPTLYAYLSPPGGWLKDSSIMQGQAQWVNYFERLAPREFIIKPSLGVYAHSFKMLERQGQRWRCKSGQVYSSTELYQSLTQDPHYDRFILQARVRNHDDFTQVSHSEALQTVRVVTLMNSKGKPQIINALLKIVQGNNITDNFAGGDSGNLLANLNIETGQILAVVGKKNGSLESITYNQQTRKNYLEFTVPLWKETKELALDAATKFLPIQTIGWDIAITQNGPLMIEGNQCWDPGQNFFKEGLILRNQLALK
jgi:hypothetical protein